MYGNDEIKSLMEAAARVPSRSVSYKPVDQYYGGMDEIPQELRPKTLKAMRDFLPKYRKAVAQKAADSHKMLSGKYGRLGPNTAAAYQRYADRAMPNLDNSYDDQVTRAALQALAKRGSQATALAKMPKRAAAQPEAEAAQEEGDAAPREKRRTVFRPGQAPEVMAAPEPEQPETKKRKSLHDLQKFARQRLGYKSGGFKAFLNRLNHESYFHWRSGKGITEAYEVSREAAHAANQLKISRLAKQLGAKVSPEAVSAAAARRGRPTPPEGVEPERAAKAHKRVATIVDPVKPKADDVWASLPKRPALPDWAKKKK